MSGGYSVMEFHPPNYAIEDWQKYLATGSQSAYYGKASVKCEYCGRLGDWGKNCEGCGAQVAQHNGAIT